MSADSQWNSDCTGASMSLARPAHTETDSSMTLAAAKPATARRRNRSALWARPLVVADLRRLGRMKAGVLQRGGKRLCVGAPGIEPHGDALGRQIGARARDARRGEQRLLHGGHAAAAAHVRDDEGHVTGLARGWEDDWGLAAAERGRARFHGLIHSRSLAS